MIDCFRMDNLRERNGDREESEWVRQEQQLLNQINNWWIRLINNQLAIMLIDPLIGWLENVWFFLVFFFIIESRKWKTKGYFFFPKTVQTFVCMSQKSELWAWWRRRLIDWLIQFYPRGRKIERVGDLCDDSFNHYVCILHLILITKDAECRWWRCNQILLICDDDDDDQNMMIDDHVYVICINGVWILEGKGKQWWFIGHSVHVTSNQIK